MGRLLLTPVLSLTSNLVSLDRNVRIFDFYAFYRIFPSYRHTEVVLIDALRSGTASTGLPKSAKKAMCYTRLPPNSE